MMTNFAETLSLKNTDISVKNSAFFKKPFLKKREKEQTTDTDETLNNLKEPGSYSFTEDSFQPITEDKKDNITTDKPAPQLETRKNSIHDFCDKIQQMWAQHSSSNATHLSQKLDALDYMGKSTISTATLTNNSEIVKSTTKPIIDIEFAIANWELMDQDTKNQVLHQRTNLFSPKNIYFNPGTIPTRPERIQDRGVDGMKIGKYMDGMQLRDFRNF